MISKTDAELHSLTSFKTAAKTHSLVLIEERNQLYALPTLLKNSNFVVLGGGSNVLFTDDYSGVVIVNALKGLDVVAECDDAAVITIAAGELWHDCVCKMSARSFHGLENLALIPGSVGAAPIQNIGAYGVEVSQLIDGVEVFDLVTNKFERFSNNMCEFGYRSSVFKQEQSRERYIVTAVTFRLSKTFKPTLSYQGLQFESEETINAERLLERVITVRQSKLPDPNILPNAGSFFKNPIVSRTVLQAVQKRYSDVFFFDVDESSVKISAAWLIERAGFKGEHRDNGAGVYEKHALILVNRSNAHGRDIYQLATDIIAKIQSMFGIELEPEVRIIGS